MKKDASKFLKALSEGAEQLDRLNNTFPSLANNFTRNTVEEFRRRPIKLEQHFMVEKSCSSIGINNPAKPDVSDTDNEDQELTNIIHELLVIHGLEDVLDILQTKHQSTLNMVQLVNLAGPKAYIQALRREAREFQANAISVEQVAQLWKDFGRPTLDNSAWTANSVSMLLE
ncbi:hypothetical protein MNBD_GAMMA26-2516 [hydrothermal vent metagenome]|uniref:Uncharacterized protein n=1 Tax=hydrothermal vent metagenome TaxID=652676 RepID=A0A3B1C3F3_9ZZZZ